MPQAGTFAVEYAKSSRSLCKKCQKTIKEGTPRIGMFVQSAFFDGATPMWYHYDCSLNAHVGKKLLSIDSLQGLETLRWDDQEQIKEKFEKLVKNIEASGEIISEDGLRVEYAKSGGSKCRDVLTFGCDEKIAKGLVRLGFLVDGPYGPIPAWHHINCFIEHHKEKCKGIENFTGHKNLVEEDLSELKQKLGSIPNPETNDNEQDDEKKDIKSGHGNAINDLNMEKELKNQNKMFWEIRDILQKEQFQKQTLMYILQCNGIIVEHKTEQQMLDIIADLICFGLAPKCTQCDKTRLIWKQSSAKYQCPSEFGWGKCPEVLDVSDIKRFSKFAFPKDASVKKLTQKKYSTHLKRVYAPPKEAPKKLITLDELKASKKTAADDSKQGEEKKGKLRLKGHSAVDPESDLVETHHVFTDRSSKTVYSVMLAESNVETGRNSFYNIQILEGDWVGTTLKKPKKSGSGSAAYYVFRRWGRVGTTIGDSRLERCDSLDEAIEQFKHHFHHKTGNEFGSPFEKQPHMFYPLEMEEVVPKELENEENQIIAGSKTKLPTQVQDLLLLIFDVEAMKRALLEFEFDLDKMPLGNISKKQIKEAYSILGQISDCLNSETKRKKASVTNLSNQYYTLIPHNMGRGKLQPLDSNEVLKSELNLLETLMEIDIATKIIQHDKDAGNRDKDPLDIHYESLHSDIRPLDTSSSEFHVVQKYLETTHAPTHEEYHLELLNVFEVFRKDELEQYKNNLTERPSLKDNRMLLWHGSRLTNYAGIISQGLRIAPPEAPSTGYMFGKGVYFADMVSKSANYCCTSPDDNTGLLVLSEVALGKSQELLGSEYIEDLPDGFDSVKGCGKTIPSVFEHIASPINVESKKTRGRKVQKTQTGMILCPIGPPQQDPNIKKSELLYNEYIVYDTKQILMRYLVQVKFNYKESKTRRK